MSTGISIVASRLGRIAEMLQEERGGLLVLPGDTKALTAALSKLAHDPGLRNRLGAAAREILLEEGYASEITTERIMTLCEEAVERKSLSTSETNHLNNIRLFSSTLHYQVMSEPHFRETNITLSLSFTLHKHFYYPKIAYAGSTPC